MKSFRLLVAVAVTLSFAAVSRGADSASISGKITFDGTPPKRKKINTDADPKCAEMHADSPLLSEEVVVNPDGTLRNVFVYIKSGLEGKTYDVPKEPVTINQTGCHYVPHVFGMMAKQELDILNSDDTLHNIHAMPAKSPEFNVGEPNKGMIVKRKFPNPEVMVHFKCDVHPWMSAYVGVMDNPFYSVTGDDGTFSLKGLPAGEYTVAAWQEKYGEQVQKVKIGDGEAKSIDFKFTKPAE
ncbi:MAG: carboxypeptidase regulatory-like domain-containing protein [Verrucomicrobiia bacterium]